MGNWVRLALKLGLTAKDDTLEENADNLTGCIITCHCVLFAHPGDLAVATLIALAIIDTKWQAQVKNLGLQRGPYQ